MSCDVTDILVYQPSTIPADDRAALFTLLLYVGVRTSTCTGPQTVIWSDSPTPPGLRALEGEILVSVAVCPEEDAPLSAFFLPHEVEREAASLEEVDWKGLICVFVFV